MHDELPRRETFTIMHRMHFFAKPQGLMNTWEYRYTLWSTPRPPDGAPPLEAIVECPQCSARVRFHVLSAAEMRRRKRLMGWSAVASVVITAICIILIAVLVGLDDASSSAAVGAGIAGLVVLTAAALGTAFGLWAKSSEYLGVIGADATAKGLAKHSAGAVPRRLLEGAQG